jgi:hypothetical protein
MPKLTREQYAALLPPGIVVTYDRTSKTYALRSLRTGKSLCVGRPEYEVETMWHHPAEVWASIAERCQKEGYNDSKMRSPEA